MYILLQKEDEQPLKSSLFLTSYPCGFAQFMMQDLSEEGAISSGGSAPQKECRHSVFCMNHPEHILCIRVNFGQDRA